MDDEISDKAKKSLADNARQKAFDRLERAGAHSTAAMQRRVRALAAERDIPPADIHKLMYKRPSTETILVFCKKHKVSFDWLLAGDLKELKRMTQERALQPAPAPRAKRFAEKYRSLPPEAHYRADGRSPAAGATMKRRRRSIRKRNRQRLATHASRLRR
jgi:hypothetical protein